MHKKWVISGLVVLLLAAFILSVNTAQSYRSDQCQIVHRACQYNCHDYAENIHQARSCSLDCFALYHQCETERQSKWSSFNFKKTWN